MRRPKFDNPTHQKYFEAMVARAFRQRQYQRLLWSQLRSMMAEGRRDQSSVWRRRFIKLLERTAKHERLLAFTLNKGNDWIYTSSLRISRRPRLRVIRGGKR